MAKDVRLAADVVLETPETTLVDLVDHLLNRGVMADGDVTLGVAGIDLIYLRLSALLCAADRVLSFDTDLTPKRRRRRLAPRRVERRLRRAKRRK
jgi:gas vesicle protein GvpA/GvpJ/GvpM family